MIPLFASPAPQFLRLLTIEVQACTPNTKPHIVWGNLPGRRSYLLAVPAQQDGLPHELVCSDDPTERHTDKQTDRQRGEEDVVDR